MTHGRKDAGNLIRRGSCIVANGFLPSIERTFQDLNISDGGQKIQRRNYNEDQRLAKALTNLFRDRNVQAKVAKIIVNDALSRLPEPAHQELHDKLIGGAAKMTSRAALQISIRGYLGSKVVSALLATTITKLSLRLWTGSIVGVGGIALQGIISRAAEASRRLRSENHGLWQQLYINNYDMIYFLFEKPLQNFLQLRAHYVIIPTKRSSFYVKSTISRIVRKILSEVSGALVIAFIVVGVFVTYFVNEGVMRFIAPVAILLVGAGLYWLSWLIASRQDRK